MKIFRHTILAGLMLAGVASVHAQQAAMRSDIIFMANGEKVAGKVIGLDAQSYKVQKALAASTGAPAGAAPMMATVMLPRKDVVRIEFAADDAREKKLAAAEVAQLAEVEAMWRAAEPWLTIPKNPAGRVGLVYGDLLLKTKDAANARKALDIFKKVEAESWNDEDLVGAKRGRLRGMIATGQASAAIEEAKALAKDAEDPLVLIEANYIMAEASNEAFRKLIADNPRWQQDLLITPERNRLYAETLNLYLYPYLFFGSEVEPAARGLAGAIAIYQFTGEEKLAESTAQDLVTIYPGTTYAAEAQKYLDSLPKKDDESPKSTETKK